MLFIEELAMKSIKGSRNSLSGGEQIEKSKKK
jgi:hypothetical protein